MVDRIEPPKRFDLYRIHEKQDTGRDDGEDDDHPEKKSFFEEKTDWRLFYEKTPHITKTKTVMGQAIDHILFRRLSIKNNPAILEADLIYRGRTQAEGPVFIPLPRELALKFQHCAMGERLSKESIGAGHHLQVMIPEAVNPGLVPGTETSPPVSSPSTPRSWWQQSRQFFIMLKGKPFLSLEFILLYSTIALFIGFFSLLIYLIRRYV